MITAEEVIREARKTMTSYTAKELMSEAERYRKECQNPKTGVPTVKQHLWSLNGNLRDLRRDFGAFKTENDAQHVEINKKVNNAVSLKTLLAILAIVMGGLGVIIMFLLQKLWELKGG